MVLKTVSPTFSDPNAVDLSAMDLPVNAVGTALKQWLRDLPEPLVPHELFDELIEAAG